MKKVLLIALFVTLGLFIIVPAEAGFRDNLDHVRIDPPDSSFGKGHASTFDHSDYSTTTTSGTVWSLMKLDVPGNKGKQSPFNRQFKYSFSNKGNQSTTTFENHLNTGLKQGTPHDGSVGHRVIITTETADGTVHTYVVNLKTGAIKDRGLANTADGKLYSPEDKEYKAVAKSVLGVCRNAGIAEKVDGSSRKDAREIPQAVEKLIKGYLK